MSTPTVKVDLTNKIMNGTLSKTLEEMPVRMARWTDEVLNQIADLMVGYAKVYVRVDTGSLRDSIRKERPRGPPPKRTIRVRSGGFIVNPKTGRLVDYAVIVEAKFPYMRPAWETVQPEAQMMIQGGFLEMLEE